MSTTTAVPEPWKGTSTWPSRGEVSREAVEQGLYSLKPFEGATAVCSTGSGHSLTDLHICMSEDQEQQTIILDETCADVRIQDSVFEGVLSLRREYWKHSKCLCLCVVVSPEERAQKPKCGHWTASNSRRAA
jgi:hypothetical protein